MNISTLLDETEEFTAEYGGHKIVFQAAKASLTPSVLLNLSKITDYPKAVAEVVRDWDVTSDNKGTKWPLDEESLGRLPVKFLAAILDKIGESWAGEKKSETPSQNGSAATAG